MRKQVGKRGVASLHAQLAAQFAALDFNHGLIKPFGRVEEPSAEHLFGSETLVRGIATEFGGEILGKGLQRADTSFVEYIHLSHLVRTLARQGGRGGLGSAGHQHQHKGECAQQPTEMRLGGEKHPHQSCYGKQITQIGHSDAEGVVSHTQGGSALHVVVGLVKTVAFMAVDVVHGDDGLVSLHRHVADEVHWGFGAGIGHQFEVLECHVEGEGEGVAVVHGTEVVGGSLGQYQVAVLTCPCGEPASQQNDYRRTIEQQLVRGVPQFVAHNGDDTGHAYGGKQQDKPPGIVDMVHSKSVAVVFFYNGADSEDNHYRHHEQG